MATGPRAERRLAAAHLAENRAPKIRTNVTSSSVVCPPIVIGITENGLRISGEDEPQGPMPPRSLKISWPITYWRLDLARWTDLSQLYRTV